MVGGHTSLGELESRREIVWLAPHEAHHPGLERHFPGPSPVVGGALLMNQLEDILNLAPRRAYRELKEARQRMAYERRLHMHRSIPLRAKPHIGPLDAPVDDVRVPITGVVRVGAALNATASVLVLLAGRPFARLTLERLPLEGIVDLPEEAANETFEALRDDTKMKVIRALERSAHLLLRRAVESSPWLLVDHPSWRALLIAWLALDPASTNGRRSDHQEMLELLRSAKLFGAVQGEATSLEEASSEKQVYVCDPLTSDWLGPGEHESAAQWDRPMLSLTVSSEPVIAALSGSRRVYNASGVVQRLQATRRIKRGLVERPTLGTVDPALKASFAELTEGKPSLGFVGELGLAGNQPPGVLLHVGGRFIERLYFASVPPVLIALESPEILESSGGLPRHTETALRALIRPLLLTKIIPRLASLPHWVYDQVRQGWLVGEVLNDDDVAKLPLFESTDDRRRKFADLRQQAARFGDVWMVPQAAFLERRRLPLHPERIAIRTSPAELDALATKIPAIDASAELALDEKARRNRAVSPVSALTLPSSVLRKALATVELESGPLRGTVALLHPGAVSDAKILVHREMRPLGVMRGPDGWPIAAAIEDPRLEPNRTHEQPIVNEVWKQALRDIEAAAETTWEDVVLPTPPPDALCVWTLRRSKREPAVRGRLWLIAGTGEVRVVLGATALNMLQKTRPLQGTLFAFHPDRTVRREEVETQIDMAFRELCKIAEGKLLSKNPPDSAAEIEAILLHATLASAWTPTQRYLSRPVPNVGLNPGQLAALYSADAPLDPRAHDALDADWASRVPAALVKVLRSYFREVAPSAPRTNDVFEVAMKRGTSPPIVKTATAPAASPTQEEEKVPEPHPLEPVRYAVDGGLRQQGLDIETRIVAGRKAPMLEYGNGFLRLAGRHPVLLALEAARVAKSPDADRALRLLVAHAVGVLDRALTSVTETHQRQANRSLLQ